MILMLSGCATAGSMEENVSEINYEDGISKEEAKAIAVNYIKQQGLEIDTSRCGVVDADRMWQVRFYRSNWSLKVFTVAVNKKTGRIIYAE